LMLIAIAFPVIGLAESSSSNGLVSDAVAILSSSSLSKKEREEFRGEVKGIRATSTLSVDEKRGKIEEEWKEKQKNLEKIRNERGKKAQDIRANTQKTILDKREVLKIDLKKIKDERKSQIVEKMERSWKR